MPPTMEVQKGTFKEFNDKEYNSRGLKVAQLVAQQKGLNEATKDSFKRYARVMVDTDIGNYGDYETLDFNISALKKTDIAELEIDFKSQIEQSTIESAGLGFGQMKLVEWHPLKLESINGMSCIHVSYTRQLNFNPLVIVHQYDFQNNDRLHRLTLSFRSSESDYWQADFADILKSFRITTSR